MQRYVLDLEEIDRAHVGVVGGKGAHLGELARLPGVSVPPGFCVTTAAYRRVRAQAPALDQLLDRLSQLELHDRDELRARSAEVRALVEGLAMPEEVAAAIAGALADLGEHTPCAVRSSATAEDLPTASFAGQQDSFLGVVGTAAVLQHVKRCWASLFTERAVTYRVRNGFDHSSILMGVVVQQMVFPDAAGILFTADPVTGNRSISTVEATTGLAEALVSGLVNADVFKVRQDQIIARTVQDGRNQTTLADAQVVQLARFGRQIERHFGQPQDIEWCLAGAQFHFVQARPITTLFPIPDHAEGENRVYLSVGHQQMMTDPLKPLGLSFWQMTTPRPMAEAGGRLFVDVTPQLASPASCATFLNMVGKSDPLMRDALQTLLDRGDFNATVPDEGAAWTPPGGGAPAALDADAALVTELIERTQASIATLKRDIRHKSGAALLEFIRADIPELRRILFDPQSLQVIMAGMDAAWWLNEQLHAWLGEKNAADALTQSVPHNITSEMGLALLDVADAIRPYPEVVAFLKQVDDDAFLDALPGLPGGSEARDAIRTWLEQYGMRGVGEIDITRPRWSERPSTLVPIILGHVRNFPPGEAARRFEQGRREALQKADEVLARVRRLPDGEKKAAETQRMIGRVRAFAGYREYPKYGMVSRYFLYKQALLDEAGRLVQAGVLRDAGDIFYLRFDELHDAVRTHNANRDVIRQRQDAYRSYLALTPPRVLTSDGEMLTGSYRRHDLPADALVGLAVSAGTVEGRARVVRDIAGAHVEPGDILVTAYTDPSWTPLFVAIRGLVTEVGGLMTHGAVIAREYGLPAVVGVEHATRRIRDGQRIRVHGSEGYVEVLTAAGEADR